MLPITRANLQNFCRVCLRDISDEKGISKTYEILSRQNFLPDSMCSNCDVKLCALRQFRFKAIISSGVLRLIVDEESHKRTPNPTSSKLKSICRICLKNHQLVSYSAEEENQAEEISNCIEWNIFEMLGQNNLNDVLKGDATFPDKLCNKCHTTLKSFREFRNISKQTADYLKNVFDEFGNETSQAVLLSEEMQKTVKHENETNELRTEFVDQAKLVFENHLIEQKNETQLGNNNINLEALNTEEESLNNLSENSSNADLNFDAEYNEESLNVFSADTDLGLLSNKLSTNNKADNEIVQDKEETKNFHKASYNESSLKLPRTPKTFKKSYKCLDCNKSFYKRFMYEAHIKSVHQNIEKPFDCPNCEKSFRLVQMLHRHMDCCHERNTSSEVGSINTCRPNYTCLFCQKNFKRKDHLKEHTRAVHEKLKPFSCGICGKTFGTRNTQIRHEKNHSNEKPFSCEYCAKRYNSESELKVHIQRHTANPELLCPICKRGKQTIEELQAHIAMHKAQYQCTQCGKIFKKMFHLREHESTVHLKSQSLKCNFCDLTFTIRKTLKNHENSHNAIGRPEKCTLCELNFKTKRALLLHTKKLHANKS